MTSAALNSILYLTGTSTAMTTEACTEDGNNAQITSTAKRLVNPAVARTWYDGGVEEAPASENLLFGKATWAALGGAATVTGEYLPLLELVWCCAYDIDIKLGTDDNTVFAAATAYESIKGQVLTASGKIDCYDPGQVDYDSGGGTVKLATLVTAGTQFALAITLGASGVDFRAFVRLTQRSVSSARDKNCKGSYSWELASQAASTTTWTHCAFSDQ